MNVLPFFVVLGVMILSLGLVMRRVMGPGRRHSSRGPGPGAAGAVYDMLNEDKRKAIEIILEERAEYRDPESADDVPKGIPSAGPRLRHERVGARHSTAAGPISTSPFRDRRDAGRQLAERLTRFADRADVVVLALPRGGVPVAAEIAARLHAPLDVFLVRKLGVPSHPELAMGAIAEGGVTVLSRELIAALEIPEDRVEQTAARERLELDRRSAAFRGGRPTPAMADRIVILVDDGLATGSTMEAAILALRERKPARIVVAVPVAAAETAARMATIADDLIAVIQPALFQAVGEWYDDFSQLDDEEVVAILSPRT